MRISGAKESGTARAGAAFLCSRRRAFHSSCSNYRHAPTERAGATRHDGRMILQKWLEELRRAMSEQDVVDFARSKLERARAGVVPADIVESPLATGNDVRELAARLATVPASASNDLLQQLLIVFSLA